MNMNFNSLANRIDAQPFWETFIYEKVTLLQ